MTSETQQNPKPQEKKVFSEARGQYSMLDGNKVYHFQFPLANSIEDNFAAISFMKTKIMEAIDEKEKKEIEKEIIKPQDENTPENK